jgi:hypothetical protein
MDMQLTNCCHCGSPVGEGLAIALLLAPFVPFVVRSRRRAAILAAVGALFTLLMFSASIEILQLFAPDDVAPIVSITGAVVVVAAAVRLLRGPDRLAVLGTES